MAQVLEINKLNDDVHGASRLDHFDYHEGGEIQSDIVLEHKNITPHCLDHDNQRLIFADLPDDIDLCSAPFVYYVQYKHATRLIAVPYAELPDLAAQVKMPKTLAFIFSTGRAGSTLMNQILNEVDGVSSLSEPDVFLNLVKIANRTSDHDELPELLTNCLRLLVKSHSDDVVAIKHRGECIQIAPFFYQAFPDAKNLFMYRNALDWNASWRRVFLEQGFGEELSVASARAYNNLMMGMNRHFDAYIDTTLETVNLTMARCTNWMYYVGAYFDAYEKGVPFLTLRYSDLNSNRRDILAKIFDYIGLSMDNLDQAMRGFERDAQAGTPLQREGKSGNTVQLDEDNTDIVHQMLARNPRNLTPDMILPGTLLL